MRAWITLALLLAAGACASGGGEGVDREWITDFDAEVQSRPGYSLRGNARAVASVGRTVVTLNVERGDPGAVHPWHVHTGACGSGGGIVGDAGDYPQLVLDGDGEDREVATLDLQLSDDAEYHVNVHRSPQDMGTIVACGRLVD